MRFLLIFAVVTLAASAVVLPRDKLNAPSSEMEGMRLDADPPSCRDGFQYYKGWCVYSTPYGHEYSYDRAAYECDSMDAFAPSIHSNDDLSLWEESSRELDLYVEHFWLDAHCITAGQPYVWRDGTPTDYYGPNNGNTFAPAVCVYDPLATTTSKTTTPTTRTTSTSTTARTSTTITQKKPTDVTSNYCSCNPTTLYLDIVFVVDTSDDMPRNVVGDAAATIQSTLYDLTLGTGRFQSNVAALAFAESVEVVRDFGDFRTSKDISSFSLPYLGGNSDKIAEAIKKASSMIHSNGRSFSRGAIVLLADSFDQDHASAIDEAAKTFKDDGGVIISIDYSAGIGIQGLKDIASSGFYVTNASSNPNLDSEMLYSFCDLNCFCKDGLVPYTVTNDRGREVPRSCFHVSGFPAVYQAAENYCADQKGFVATVHDDETNFFLISLFPKKSRYWIGLRKNGANYEWADGSSDTFTYWAEGNPILGQDCVYAQQQNGFNSPWFSAPCSDPLENSMSYACQLRPCGSDYDCSF